jgi:response regulator RpfG family c-di-GMP phosphodiesterase
MKLVNKDKDSAIAAAPALTWKLLVVDDEPDIHKLTQLSLKDFRFAGRSLEILSASSGYAARDVFRENPDIAVALIDVVMETDDAGLRLVEHVRNELKNEMVRIIIRTGQPGVAPERFVIDHYDIDDYKDKTELTATRLYTTVRTAIKSYRDLKTIDLNRIGLSHVLAAAPDIYRLAGTSLSQFFEGVLTQIVGLCNLSETSCLGTLDGVVATMDGQEVNIHAACGGLKDATRFEQIRDRCTSVILAGNAEASCTDNLMIVPLAIGSRPVGFVYIEAQHQLTNSDRNLIHVLAQQCSSALENKRLHLEVQESFDHAIDMLAEVAEFKDKNTGGHISRIDNYTRTVAIELGVSPDEAQLWGKASRLHDVGKIGVADALLQKPGKLDPEEFDEVRKHTHIGASILDHDKFMAIAREVAYSHHERWDGKGYPEGKRSRDLSLLTRIVSVVDVFDALMSPRPYKEPWDIEQAAAEIEKGAGSQFDPTVVEAFLNILRRGDFNDHIESSRAGTNLRTGQNS